MKIETKNIYEIKVDGKIISFIYSDETSALNAINKIHQENTEFINKTFPKGIFK